MPEQQFVQISPLKETSKDWKRIWNAAQAVSVPSGGLQAHPPPLPPHRRIPLFLPFTPLPLPLSLSFTLFPLTATQNTACPAVTFRPTVSSHCNHTSSHHCFWPHCFLSLSLLFFLTLPPHTDTTMSFKLPSCLALSLSLSFCQATVTSPHTVTATVTAIIAHYCCLAPAY